MGMTGLARSASRLPDRTLVAEKILCRLRIEVNHSVKKPAGRDLPYKSARLERCPCRSSLKATPGGVALTIRDDCGSRQSYAAEMQFSIPNLIMFAPVVSQTQRR